MSSEFVFNNQKQLYTAKIILYRGDNQYYFYVLIPQDYPYGDVKFIPETLSGYPHQNFDGSICLNVPFVDNLYSKIRFDIDKLIDWVNIYVENQKQDDFYEYTPADYDDRILFVFEEEGFDSTQFKNEKFGVFKYSILNKDLEKGKVSRITAVARNLGNRDQAWNTRFAHNQTYLGVWVFLDKEPTYNNKKRYENWSDIEGIFPTGFDIFFSKFHINTPLYKLVPKSFSINILFAIGYKIPKEFGNYELHWDLALFPKSQLKNKQKRILNFKNMNKITWVRTLNSSYARFFGRGAFCNTICNSKIMVIGVGAIGSSLSEILVRGGAKEICLVDSDNVEPGNICRSKYTFNNIGISKIHELEAYLTSISPFVNVATKFGINVISKYNSRFNDLRNEISQYDLVFDCTANGEIGHLLQSMNISNTVFHICITDKAKEMLFISNSDNENANERRNQMLYALGSFQWPGFREGVGCWHPTFEASFFDINQMLNYALKKMNDLYKVQKPINSFYVLCKNGLLASIDDVNYYQPDLKLSITITSNCLDKIYDLVWHFYPNEFGGVFVGNYINDNKEVIISDIITSNRFKNSQSRFEPDHKDLSQKINDLYETHRGQLIYIGDWHSHPNGNNMYSPPDYDSIRRVAYSSTVNTKNPLLMIAAFGRNYFDPGFYVFFEGRLYKYEKKNK